MLSINNVFHKNNWVYTTKLFILALGLSVVACASAPYQEMSDARQMIASATEEVSEAGLNNSDSIQNIIRKAKNQLAKAKALLNEEKYDEARELAIKASKLARLAKSEINIQK